MVNRLFAVSFCLLTGCGVSHFSARTLAEYGISPDGSRIIRYDSQKEQNGLDATWTEDKNGVKTVRIRVEKAATPESAIAAAAAAQERLAEMLQQLLPLIAAMAKASAGVP